MQLSLRWAKRSRAAFDALKRDRDSDAALFGIVQGGVHHDLRRESLAGLAGDRLLRATPLGGLAVGEPEEERLAVLEGLAPVTAGRSAALPDGRRHAGRSRRRPWRAAWTCSTA